jgi:hypothetical protein
MKRMIYNFFTTSLIYRINNETIKPTFVFDGIGILDNQSLKELVFKLFRIGKSLS